MSYMEKIQSIMARPGQDPNAKDDVAWYLRYGSRGLGTVGGFVAIILGILNFISILTGNISCLISAMWQIVAGFIVISCEAPCCCMFVDYVQNVSDVIDKRPYWQKATAYVVVSIPPILMCFGMNSLFGSGLIFATGVLYGMMSLGKKATAEEMRTNAMTSNVSSAAPTTIQPNSSMKANLVDNAAPIAFTGMPDSNV